MSKIRKVGPVRPKKKPPVGPDRPAGVATVIDKIPVAERRCCKLGLAHANPQNKSKVIYDWGKIQELWLADPSPTLIDFCDKYQISYSSACGTQMFSTNKKRAISQVLTGGYIFSVLRNIMALRARKSEEDAQRLSAAIAELSVFAHSAGSFARARMAKLDSSGRETVNIDARVGDVRHYSAIARDASETIRNLMSIRQDVGVDDPETDQYIDEILVESPAATKSKATSGNEQHHPSPDEDQPPEEEPGDPEQKP